MTRTIFALAATSLLALGAARAQDHDSQHHDGMDHQAMDHGAMQHDGAHEHDHDAAEADAADAAPLRAGGEARTVTVRVNGMVCDFCARSLTKVLKRDDNVEDVAISLEDKTVTILLAEGGAMDDAAVEKAVKNAGYNVASIERGAS